VIEIEEYRVAGRLHREDGPARICRNKLGFVYMEEYWVAGREHRNPDEGPALISRCMETGVLYREEYYWKGQWHRNPVDGPALISRDDSGKILHQEYFWRGEDVDPPVRREGAHAGPTSRVPSP
jgi:hypothetical protein